MAHTCVSGPTAVAASCDRIQRGAQRAVEPTALATAAIVQEAER